MNFLAHLFLSGDDEEIMVGNLLEDFVVGRVEHPRNQHLSENIKNGILLHRLIDTFTDTHPAVSACKSVLYEKHHKFASVVVDVFFDHYLAIYWKEYSTENFEKFRMRVYKSFENQWQILPEKMKPMIESMITHDWLKNYGEFSGIERAMKNVSSKTIYASNMESATDDLKLNYVFFDAQFKLFFPQILNECKWFLLDKGYEFS